MHPVLFHIPNTLFGLPVFGFGWLLGVWLVISAGILARLVRQQGFNRDTWSHVPLLVVIGAVFVVVAPALCDEEGLPIRGYGLMFLLAVLAGAGLAFWRARQRGIDPELVFSLALWICIPGFIASRAFYVIEYRQHFYKETLPETLLAIVNVTEGGLVVYGAYLGAVAGLVGFLRKYRLPALAWSDLVAPCMILGLAIGRIGCFVNGCCFGGTCELPWSVPFPWGSPPHEHQVRQSEVYLFGLKIEDPEGADNDDAPVITAVKSGSFAAERGLKPGDRIRRIRWQRPGEQPTSVSNLTADRARHLLLRCDRAGTKIWIDTTPKSPDEEPPTVVVPDSLPDSLSVHPTQLYSSVHALLLCLFLLALEPFLRRDGALTAAMLTIYPINRILLEFIRADEGNVLGTEFTISQNVSFLILAAGAGLWIWVLRQPPGRLFWPNRERRRNPG